MFWLLIRGAKPPALDATGRVAHPSTQSKGGVFLLLLSNFYFLGVGASAPPGAAPYGFQGAGFSRNRASSLCGKEVEDLPHHAVCLIRLKEKLSVR